MNNRLFSIAIVLVLVIGLLPLAATAQEQKPKLILQITVDALRGDLPLRVYDRLGEGGFRYLFEKGTYYREAHHRHANTETVVGHATLATGADPSAHGMVANVWFDYMKGYLTYNIEDARYPLLGPGGVDKKTEIDHTQKTARSNGRSPASILTSTFSDELALHYGGRSKIFGVSVKDRGAVTLAGHAGKAFWFSKKTGGFVTSSFYYNQYPDWVSKWNEKKLAFGYVGKSWELLKPQNTYLFGHADDRSYETAMPGFGRVFPHPFGEASKYFTTFLTLSPAGDELTLDFAKTLIAAENLGQDSIPDYLSISFSSTDYVGHIFGPSSLESEDNLLHLDRTLADLLAYVDKTVGLENTLIVLSADHGAPEAPGYLNELGIEAFYVDPKAMDKEGAIQNLKAKFGIGEELIEQYYHPYIYLNREAIKKKGLDQAEVERAVAAELINFRGIALAIPSSDLRNNTVPDTRLTQTVLRNFNPARSGDIYVVFEPHCFINDFDGLTVASTHGSPWRYDSFVPLVFVGKGIPEKKIYREVYTTDLAPTLSSLLGIKAPSGTTGHSLVDDFK